MTLRHLLGKLKEDKMLRSTKLRRAALRMWENKSAAEKTEWVRKMKIARGLIVESHEAPVDGACKIELDKSQQRRIMRKLPISMRLGGKLYTILPYDLNRVHKQKMIGVLKSRLAKLEQEIGL